MSKSILIAFAVWLAVGATPAAAHVVLAEPQAMSGSYYAGFFRLSHGCDGSPTTALRIEIPEGVLIARPRPKPGWRLEIERAPLPAPVQAEGGQITERRVTAITWRGRLPADQFDQFGVMMKLPASSGPLYFPTVQTCAHGARRWTDIPAPGQAWHDVPSPAPFLELAAPHDAMMDHDHH